MTHHTIFFRNDKGGVCGWNGKSLCEYAIFTLPWKKNNNINECFHMNLKTFYYSCTFSDNTKGQNEWVV